MLCAVFDEGVAGRLADLARFVAFEDLALPLLEHRHQGIEARAEAGDLAGVEADRAGQFFLGQLAVLPYISRCSKAGETRSGGGCVGLGNRWGSYFW